MPDSPGTAGEMGRRAWYWIVRRQSDFFTVSEGQSAEQKRLKCVGELALIAGTLIDDMPEARALLARAWEELDCGEDIARLLPRWPIAATSYLPFRLAGCRSPDLEKRLAGPSWLCGNARWPPFARFAVGVTLESIGVTSPWDPGEVVRANRFFARPTPHTPPIRAVFLAHAIMWRSQMGRNCAGVGAKAVELFRAVSIDWHRLLRDAGLLDPLGEMIIADVCSGGDAPTASLELLCAAQCEDGSVSPRRNDASTIFDDLYHSTCVAALAGTLSARSPQRPMREIS